MIIFTVSSQIVSLSRVLRSLDTRGFIKDETNGLAGHYFPNSKTKLIRDRNMSFYVKGATIDYASMQPEERMFVSCEEGYENKTCMVGVKALKKGKVCYLGHRNLFESADLALDFLQVTHDDDVSGCEIQVSGDFYHSFTKLLHKNKKSKKKCLESKEAEDSKSIYIGNVDYCATPDDLQQHFSDCGEINRITIPCSQFTQEPKGGIAF